MAKVIVIGAGMVGSAMALDLVKDHEVVLADRSEEKLIATKERDEQLDTLILDVTDKANSAKAIQAFDIVLLAVPGFLGFEALKMIIEAGKNVVDISFFPENSLELDELAKANSVTAIVDCGVAPGIDNLILGRLNEEMTISDFECLVGGLPKMKTWPWNYKAPFSPIDVIEEYTRPARYVRGGEIVTIEPLTEPELISFDQVAELEAFNTDGLRSIMYTMSHIPNMKEKTLRYPGHIEYIKVLRESGFFEPDALEFTAKRLIDKWKLEKEEEEFTIMRVTVKGTDNNGNEKTVINELYDEYDSTTKTSSMARTTGYTATATINMLLAGLFQERGVFPPELIGKHKTCYDFIFSYLASRNVKVSEV